MSDRYTGNVTHNRGLLAGLGAGAVAVLVGAAFLASVWRRVSGQVAVALDVIVWAFTATVTGAAMFTLGYLFLRLRLHLARPETLTRHTVRAEVIPSAPLPAAEIPAAAPLAALPPASTHYHFDTPDAVEAALRAMTGTERN